MTDHSRWENSKEKEASQLKLSKASRMIQRIIRLELETLESTKHERMHAEDAENNLEKACCWRESSEKTRRNLKLIDCNFDDQVKEIEEMIWSMQYWDINWALNLQMNDEKWED